MKTTETMRILYVEDEETVRRDMTLFFEDHFKEVVCADNGKGGLDLFRKEPFDMIITDIQMPGMNGIDMIREIRRHNEDIPIVIISAYDEVHYFQEAIGSGVEMYLIKPIDFEQFEQMMERMSEKAVRYRTHRRYLEEQNQKANFDQLTGLYNRYRMQELFEQLCQRENGEPVSVALVDLDHFKQINDQYGHTMGDKVLETFAEILTGSIPKTYAAGRWGGEEFLVLFPGLLPHQVRETLAEVQHALASHDFNIERTVTFSAGVVNCRKEDTLRSVVHRADKLLYTAKHSGRNNILADSSE
jgi:diguanylate cyclase (GGDEF)-like protein